MREKIPKIRKSKIKIWKPLCSLKEADWIIIGIPFEKNEYGERGTERAPEAIRRKFSSFWTYDIDRKKDLFESRIYDLGNIKTGNYKKTIRSIYGVINHIKEKNINAKVLFLGGDHSITPIIARALDISSILALDAHFDLKGEYAKNTNANACVMQRCYEQTKNIHMRGVRTGDKDELLFAERNIDWRKEMVFKGRVDYLSIDVDVMDPSYIHTGNPETLGHSPADVIKIIRNTEFKYADIVEWIPERGYPVVVKIAQEILFKNSNEIVSEN